MGRLGPMSDFASWRTRLYEAVGRSATLAARACKRTRSMSFADWQMPMQRSVFAPIERCISCWYDAENRTLALLILLSGFVLLWLVFQIVSYAAIDLHPDPLEVFAWGQHPSAGY